MTGNDWDCTTARLLRLMDKDSIEDKQGCFTSSWHLEHKMASKLQHSNSKKKVSATMGRTRLLQLRLGPGAKCGQRLRVRIDEVGDLLCPDKQLISPLLPADVSKEKVQHMSCARHPCQLRISALQTRRLPHLLD